ncbi:hypothetical protein MBANPS3_006696 [Mucor bainieri]
MLKDVKIEAIDQSVSMLMKKEPCNHDPAVSLASNQMKSPVVMKNVHQQAIVGSQQTYSALAPTREQPMAAVARGANDMNNSSSGSSTVPQLHPRDPRRRPRVIPASATEDEPLFASNPSRLGVNESPVIDEQAVKRPVAAKIVAPGPVEPPSHAGMGSRGWASSVFNNVTKSPVVVSPKQADVVFGTVSLRTAVADSAHHQSPVSVKIENQAQQQATLDSSYSLCGDNTFSSQSSATIQEGDCSAKPIVLSKATTVNKSNNNNKKVVSLAEYRASRKERFSSEKVYTTSIPPYDSPSTSPRQAAASVPVTTDASVLATTAASAPVTTASTVASTTTTTAATPVNSNGKRAAETSVDELRRPEQHVPNTSSCDDENVMAMESMLSDLKGKLVTLTLDLCITPDKQELSDAFGATTTQINYLKRTIASLKKDTPLLQLSDENYKKLLLMLRLVPYFQWDGNVTNPREKVFTTIHACLRQVERAAQDYDFDIERKWRSLIPQKLSSPMHHWLDGLLVTNPRLTWSQFKHCLLQEYQMPSKEAIKQLTLAHYHAETESMNSFTRRFVRNLEYAKVSNDLGFAYFQLALPTPDDRAQFTMLYRTTKKNHPQEKNLLFRAIDLFRDVHNQTCECNDAYENPPLPAPQPQPYELHQRATLQQQQQRSVSPKVETIQLQQQQQQQPKFKKQKFHPGKRPQLRCLLHPKANSHTTENCRNNPNSPSYIKIHAS